MLWKKRVNLWRPTPFLNHKMFERFVSSRIQRQGRKKRDEELGRKLSKAQIAQHNTPMRGRNTKQILKRGYNE